MNFKLLAIAWIVLVPLMLTGPAWAETRSLTAEGEYIMGEGETMEVAGEKARKNAVRAAAEQAGTFVKSYTKVNNFVLQEDVIEVVANHAMKVDVLDEQTELVGKKAIRFRTRIRATISTAEVEANIRKAQEDRTVVDSYRKLKEDYDRLAREADELKKKLREASGDERKSLLADMSRDEVLFKANVLYEKGVRLASVDRNLAAADEALSQAVALNPAFAQAYALRGDVRAGRAVEKIEPALADFERAIALEPNNAAFYMKRAMVFRRGWVDNGCSRIVKTTCPRTLADMDRAIALEPKNAWYRLQKGDLLAELERPDEALTELDAALRVGNGGFSSGIGIAVAYMKRAKVQQEKGKAAAALADLDKAVLLFDTSQFFTEADRRTLKTMRAFLEREAQKTSGQSSPRDLEPKLLEAFGIPASKAESELPRLNERIRESMEKLMILKEIYRARADLRLDARQYAPARADMRTACRWDALNPIADDRIALCSSRDLEKELERDYSPAGFWLSMGRQIEQEWYYGGDARRYKPETHRQAMDAYGKAVALDPSNAKAWEARCNFLPRSDGKYWENKPLLEQMAADCARAVRLDGNLFLARMGLAEAYANLGREAIAVEEYGKIIKLHPEAGGAKQQRLSLLRKMGRFSEAIRDADLYLGEQPKDHQLIYQKAEICEEAGRLPEALKAWEAYLRIYLEFDKERNPGEAESEQTRNARERITALKKKIR